MKIAQIAPLYESIPPKLYGGTERVVSYLVEALVAQGHDVTLFASGDSVTKATLVPLTPEALRLQGERIKDPLAHHVRALEIIFRTAADYDVLHFHLDYLHFPLLRQSTHPALTTLHGRLDLPDLAPLYREYSEMALVSVSDSQRLPLAWANWVGTVYHGLPDDLYRPHYEPDDYLVFLGRIAPEKRLDRAIAIAEATGFPLKVAAKVDAADQEYFKAQIEPLMASSAVEFVGELSDGDKQTFLSRAKALLFPIDWPEPFGLVMIEAMACGTPVVAFRAGSTPEIIVDGRSGFLVDTLEEAVSAVRRVDEVSRETCRREFEQRFTAQRMARDYLRIYGDLQTEPPPEESMAGSAPRVRVGHFS